MGGGARVVYGEEGFPICADNRAFERVVLLNRERREGVLASPG
jgi:hypothetical protein